MNWAGFAAALLGFVLLQTTAVRYLPVPGVDLLLILTLWVGLFAPANDARLAALACGFAQGLTTVDSIGAHVFSFGVAGWLITILRESLNMRSIPARFIAMFGAACGGLAVLRLFQAADRYFSRLAPGSAAEIVSALIVSAGIAAGVVTIASAIRQSRRRRLARL
jgi:hypothetical protein